MGRNLYNLSRLSVCANMAGRVGDKGEYVVRSMVRG